MDQLVETSPKEFNFELHVEKAAEVRFKVMSRSKTPVLFKLRVTAPKRFSVKPPAGLIPPGEEVEISIHMEAYEQVPPDIFSCKEKFRLEVAPQPQNVTSSDFAEMWAKVGKNSIHTETFRVKMEIKDGNSWKEIAKRKDEESKRGRSVHNTVAPDQSQPVYQNRNAMSKEQIRAKELQAMLDLKEAEYGEVKKALDEVRAATEQKEIAAQGNSERFMGVPLVQIGFMFCISLFTVKLLI